MSESLRKLMSYPEEIPETEQWLLSGDCDKCRRAKHCSKPCKRCNTIQRMYLAGVVSKAIIQTVMDDAK